MKKQYQISILIETDEEPMDDVEWLAQALMNDDVGILSMGIEPVTDETESEEFVIE